MARQWGEIVFSLTDLKIATYNILTDTIGTAVDLPEGQKFEFGFEADTDQIKAEGYFQHLLTVTTHATFTISSAGIPFEALAVITGATNASTGTTPTQDETLKFSAGGAGLPYFTIAGKMVGEQGDDVHVGLAVCKLDAPPSWTFEQNKFVISEASGKAILRVGESLVYVEAHETAEAINFTTLFT